MNMDHVGRRSCTLFLVVLALLAPEARGQDCPGCGHEAQASSAVSDLWHSRAAGKPSTTHRTGSGGKSPLRWTPTSGRPSNVVRIKTSAGERTAAQRQMLADPRERLASAAAFSSKQSLPSPQHSRVPRSPDVRRNSQIFGYEPMARALARPSVAPRQATALAAPRQASEPTSVTSGAAQATPTRPVSSNPYRQPLGW